MTTRRSRALLPPPRDDTEALLLADIDQHHEDDGPRSVYADWLLERGDRRGALFALQTKLDRGVGPWERYILERRCEDILFTGYESRVIYRRGVPDGVSFHPPAIKDELPAHLRLEWRSSTTKESYRAGIERLASHPEASRVVELDLGTAEPAWMLLFDSAVRPRRIVLPRNAAMSVADVARFRDAPLCEHLEHLEFSGAIGDDGLAMLLRAPWTKRITSLADATPPGLGHFCYKGPIGDAGVRTIAAHMPALRRLDLRGNRITIDGVQALVDSQLALDELQLSIDALGVAGLAVLAQSRLASVARVSMGIHEETEPAAYRALIESPLWAERWLDLWVGGGFDIGPITTAIASARGTPPIDELRIRGAKLDVEVIDQLLGCPAMAGLRHVTVIELPSDCEPALFGRLTARPLETLFVDRCKVGALGLAAMLESPHFSEIDNLDLERCELGDSGVQLLARSGARPVELRIWDTADFATYLTLLESPLLARTEILWLILCEPTFPTETSTVKRVLLESPHLSAVRHLWVPGMHAFSEHERIEIKHRFPGPDPLG